MMIKKSVVIILFLLTTCKLSEAIEHLNWQQNSVYEIAQSAAAIDNLLVVATKGGLLFCYNEQGNVLWQKDLKQGLLSSPLIAAQKIFLSSVDGTLFCFNFNGEEIYRKTFSASFRVSPLLLEQNEMLLFGERGEIFRINPQNGEISAEKRVNAEFFAPAAFNAEKKMVIIPDKNGSLYALSDRGEVIWIFKNRGVNFSAPALSKDKIYFTSMDHFLYALDYSGKKLWEFQTERWNISSAVLDSQENIYFGSYDQHFYAIAAGGRLLWKKRLASSVNSTALIDNRDHIIIGDSAGYIYELDSGGTTLFRQKTEDFIRNPFTIFSSKLQLIAFSVNANLFSFQHGFSISAKSYWPKFQQNQANRATLGRKN